MTPTGWRPAIWSLALVIGFCGPLLTGLEVDGIFGALVALPILSVVRETVVYLSRHLTFESWNDTSRRLL